MCICIRCISVHRMCKVTHLPLGRDVHPYLKAQHVVTLGCSTTFRMFDAASHADPLHSRRGKCLSVPQRVCMAARAWKNRAKIFYIGGKFGCHVTTWVLPSTMYVSMSIPRCGCQPTGNLSGSVSTPTSS